MKEFGQNRKTSKLSNIKNILDEKENEYMNKYPPKILASKKNSILEFINEFDDNTMFTNKHFERIRKFAVTKGGLLLNSFRKEIYQKAFFLKDDEILFIYYEESKFTEKSITTKNFYDLLNTDESDDLTDAHKPHKKTSKTDERIIELDVKRTIANSYFANYQEELNPLKQKLTKFLKLFFNLNHQYGYYQGFHEIGLYIFLIFYNYEHLAIQMLQRFAEFFLKDYMVEINNPLENNSHNNKISKADKNFQFETVFKILNDVTAQNDKKFWKFIQDHTMNSDTVNTLPWIITLFTHDVEDIMLQLRILDYILFSYPKVVYHMASYV